MSPTEATRDCISTGEVDEDTDMDTEEIDDFPTDHTPGWADLSTITDDQIESVRVLLKGRGVLKRASLISVGVSKRSISSDNRTSRLATKPPHMGR